MAEPSAGESKRPYKTMDEAGNDRLAESFLAKRGLSVYFRTVSEFFAEKLKDEVAGDGGEERYGQVGGGDDVAKCCEQGLAVAGRCGKLTHQKVCVEEEDDERDSDEGASQGAESAVGGRIGGHGSIVTAAA